MKEIEDKGKASKTKSILKDIQDREQRSKNVVEE